MSFFITVCFALSQNTVSPADSAADAQRLLKEAKVESERKEIKLTIQNVDISRYPDIKIIVEAYNIHGEPLDTLLTKDVSVLESGVEKPVISVEKISLNERVPVDFVFVIDQTGSMQNYIDAVRKKIVGLTQFFKTRGIDYRLGLVVFSDEIDKIYQPTEDVNEFIRWIERVKAFGGGDVKENALEALVQTATKIDYRPSANKVAILVTDAPFHQVGEDGKGKTQYNTESTIEVLNTNRLRLFGIVPPKLLDYQRIAQETRGNTYDIDYPFSTILDNFSTQLTNLYAIVYKTSKPAIPDSIDIAIVNERKQQITSKTISILELGRKLIIEDLLFKTGSAEIGSENNSKQLNVLLEFMKNKSNVTIMIEGHTDNVGSDATNNRLSQMRADAVRGYLTRSGISGKRIKTRGYGETRPIASNSTDFGRKLNRRTEIIIVSK